MTDRHNSPSAYLSALSEVKDCDTLLSEVARQLGEKHDAVTKAEIATVKLRFWRGLAIILGVALGLFVLLTPAGAETIPGERITVIDGDTVALPCARPAPGCAERLRLHAIDAPETRGAACEAEAIAGLEARAALRALLTGPVEVTRCEPATGRCADRYGRTLGALRTAAGDIGQLMLASGNALPWRPGPAAKFERQQHWCGR